MSPITESAHYIENPNGIRLYRKSWSPAPGKGDAAPHVLLVHGIESHTGWYDGIGSRLAREGYRVTSMDRRGCGRSDGHKGHVRSSEELLADVEWLLHDAEHFTSGAPLIGIGISLGGLISTAVAMRHPGLFSGLVNVAPAISSRIVISPLRAMKGIVENIVYPEKMHPLPMGIEMFTDDPEAREFITRDPRRNRKVSVRYFFSLRNLQKWVQDHPSEMKTPYLALLAENDAMIHNQNVRAWAAKTSSNPCEVREYPGAKHSLLYEPCRKQAIQDILSFLKRFS